MAFSEVWDDLLELLHKQQEFVTLDTKERFEVHRTNTPEEGLIFRDEGEFFAPQDALLDAWQHLRSVGFLSPEGMTQGLDMQANKVIALLARLPYLKPAKVALKHDGTERFSLAIQLVPRPAKERVSLRHPPELVPA